MYQSDPDQQFCREVQRQGPDRPAEGQCCRSDELENGDSPGDRPRRGERYAGQEFPKAGDPVADHAEAAVDEEQRRHEEAKTAQV